MPCCAGCPPARAPSSRRSTIAGGSPRCAVCACTPASSASIRRMSSCSAIPPGRRSRSMSPRSATPWPGTTQLPFLASRRATDLSSDTMWPPHKLLFGSDGQTRPVDHKRATSPLFIIGAKMPPVMIAHGHDGESVTGAASRPLGDLSPRHPTGDVCPEPAP